MKTIAIVFTTVGRVSARQFANALRTQGIRDMRVGSRRFVTAYCHTPAQVRAAMKAAHTRAVAQASFLPPWWEGGQAAIALLLLLALIALIVIVTVPGPVWARLWTEVTRGALGSALGGW